MRPVRLAALTAALVVLPATAALAHPSFNPNAVPVGEPVEAVLVVPHGCSTGASVMPEEGEAVPTTQFDLEKVDGVTVEPAEVDGWTVEDDGEAIVWTADGGATTEPIEFPVTLTVTDGTAGDQLSLSAYQECEDGSSYRWTEGAEGTPPVRLELTEGEVDTVDQGGEMDHESEMDMGATESEMPMTDEPAGEATEDVTALDADPAVEQADEGNGALVAIVAVLLVVLAVGGTVIVRRRSA